MNQVDVLDRVIAKGIASVLESYPAGSAKQMGALEGFEACRGKTPQELLELYHEAEMFTNSNRVEQAMLDEEHLEEHWRRRYASLQVEWCLNAMAAFDYMATHGRRSFAWLGWHPTVRAAELVAGILQEVEVGHG